MAKAKSVECSGPARRRNKLARDLAMLCEQLEHFDLAERYYRQFAREAKEPRAILDLAAYLGRRKQLIEALDLCDKAWASCNPDEVGGVSVRALRAGGGKEADCLRVQSRIEAALRKESRVGLLFSLARVAELRARFQDAETIYRKILSIDKGRADALNNLANVLIQQNGNPEEALQLAKGALDLLGPLPELLDTLAVVYLTQGKTSDALAVLTEVIDRPGIEPRVIALAQLHRAWAHQQNHDGVSARADLAQAEKTGFRTELLSPLDRAVYEKLAQDLGIRP